MYTVNIHDGKPAVFSERGLVCICEAGYQQTREQDATRIARALNRDAAMGEVREALAFTLRKLESLGYVGVDMDFSRQALAALDAAGKGE